MFFKQLHQKISKAYKEGCDKKFSPLLDEFFFFSQQIDKIALQDSSLFRNRKLSIALCNILIDEKGKLQLAQLKKLQLFFKEHLFCLGPGHTQDNLWRKQIYRVLLALDDPGIQRQIESFQFSPGDEKMMDIIRDTLELDGSVVLQKSHLRKAVLSASFAYLRQNVGSCFATAPAILVQTEKLSWFLDDLFDLLSSSVLKRTFSGVEYSVPLSRSSGIADLRRPFIMTNDLAIEKTPGIFYALLAAGLFEEKLPKKRALEQMREKIQKVFGGLPPLGEIMTPKDLFQIIIARHFGLNSEDFHVSNFLSVFEKQKKTAKIKNFNSAFEEAQRVFKRSSDNALLKVWEFTLASFAETKAVFSRWNFYASLGLAPDDRGGIGACIYQELELLLKEANEKAAQVQEPYEQSYRQLQYLELKIERAGSDQEHRYLMGEYQAMVGEMNSYLEERDRYVRKAQILSRLFDQIIDFLDGLFQEYFQEVYDADLHEVTSEVYDDSPAGFRLLYKHGRSHSHLWTQITNPEEFSDALRDFFMMTESCFLRETGLEELAEEYSQIVTKIVQHVVTEEFLLSALCRMAKVHGGSLPKKPLENLSLVDKKPWVYTSGGTMNHLVSCYFRRENLPDCESKWVESPVELLAFFIDTMKALPPQEAQVFIDDPQKSLLCHSPTHAFLFKPGLHPFCQTWQAQEYTYTWVRDRYTIPCQSFIKGMDLCEHKQFFLINELAKSLTEPFRKSFEACIHPSKDSKSVEDFRLVLTLTIDAEPSLQCKNVDLISKEEIDSLFFSQLPLFLGHEVEEVLRKILCSLFINKVVDRIFFEQSSEIASKLCEPLTESDVISSPHIQDLIKGVFLLVLKKPFCEQDLCKSALATSRNLGFALPAPLIFADSNWSRDFFAFLINPGNLELELWKVDPFGVRGSEMKSWRSWLDGSRTKPTWGIYPRKRDYGS